MLTTQKSFYEYTCPGCGKVEISDKEPARVRCEGRFYEIAPSSIRKIEQTVPKEMHDAKILEIPLEEIVTHPIKMRPVDDAKVNELALSFRSQGQRQPILVRRVDGHFRVVFGEHRLEAAKRAGLTAMLCMVDDSMDDSTEMELKITENIQRNNFVDPSVEGQMFKELSTTKYPSVMALANAIGKPVAYVFDRIRIFEKLHPCIKPLVGGKISISNAIAISKLPEAKQLEIGNALLDSKSKMHGGFGQVRIIEHDCECSKCGNKHYSKKDEIDCPN